MSTTQAFRPSDAFKRVAEDLLAAVAFEEAIREKVEAYQRRILAENDFRVDPRWATQGVREDIRITEDRDAYLMRDADAARYLELCDEARREAGLSVSAPGNCPLLEAQTLRIMAEDAFLKALGQEIQKPEIGQLHQGPRDLRKRALELGMELAAPFVDRAACARPLLDMVTELYEAGFYVGVRDPQRNRAFVGRFMVCENPHFGPTDDASTGGFCIVGDNIRELVEDAYQHLLAMKDDVDEEGASPPIAP